MISRDRFPPAIENVHTEMPTTNSMAILLNSKNSMSSVRFSESSEEIEPERTIAESFWPHHFASASASTTSSTPQTIIPEATPNELGATPIDLEATPIAGTSSRL